MNGFTKKQPSRRRRNWACVLLLALIMAIGAFTLVMEMTSLIGPPGAIGLTWRNRFTKWLSAEEAVSNEDLLHHSLLFEVCVEDTNASIPWQFGSPGNQLVGGTANNSHVLMHKSDKDLLQKLRQCPDIDVFLPHGTRSYGYCEDAVAYVKYLESRLLPEWVLEIKVLDPDLGREVDYFDLCPKTPMLFLDHHWGGLTESPRWPQDKPVYMMPNIEKMEITPMHFLRVDAVLCKSHECYERVTKWFEQYGNRRDAKVFYTKHTSSSPELFVRKRLGEYAVALKDFSNVRFVHTAGSSHSKGTREVVECWLSNPKLPPLDAYIDREPFNRLFSASTRLKIARSLSPVNIHLGMLKPLNYSKVVAEASFVVSPSYSEGYGHIINQARATGAVIVTTDLPPMNELITAKETGMLISVQRRNHPMVMLGGKYRGRYGLKDCDGLVASFESSEVCKVIKQVLQLTTPTERAEMGFNARWQYHADTKYFAKAMQQLRDYARKIKL
ncbi:unnamed protein product [Peronospora farinosa]|uniref:Glycosyl transferase family 1 domain-containing protein n=1 Tax=Peronospora farinosa TaxID=134698 RepID=A0AAV0UH79_9STRA|nr:unnamed protein product [Peronospora farinosa]CAI5735533.1 unnamed protein product [Peronospora farinosa]